MTRTRLAAGAFAWLGLAIAGWAVHASLRLWGQRSGERGFASRDPGPPSRSAELSSHRLRLADVRGAEFPHGLRQIRFVDDVVAVESRCASWCPVNSIATRSRTPAQTRLRTYANVTTGCNPPHPFSQVPARP